MLDAPAGAQGARPDGPARQVWHDAAYFLPLHWFYHHSCREETAGLEVADVIVGHDVPHFHIRDNLTRGRDGEMAGEKRGARNRKLPNHAKLIRLGFLDYVEAIRAEGHVALFPELYLNEEKRGGAHFYERASQHMVDYIAPRLPLPVNPAGKGPDLHSIRALGSSSYEVDGVNALMRADVMGHAREGTNGKHYSKRMATEGLKSYSPSGATSSSATSRRSPEASILIRYDCCRWKSVPGSVPASLASSEVMPR